MTYIFRTILWSFLIYNFVALFGNQVSSTFRIDQASFALFIAPVLEELLKFIAARSVGKPVLVGLGVQATEMIVYGLDAISKLVVSPHWMTMMIYTRYGLRWRAVPFAIALHFFWNAYWTMQDPLDKIPAIALMLSFAAVAFMLRNKYWKNLES